MSENVGMYEPSNPMSDLGDAPAPVAATDHESDGSRPGFLDRPLAAFIRLDWETVIWIAIFLVAIVTRFYMLGVRAMSHDESLHSLYSYNLYANGNYEHNPMMHGPFRYHVSAFIYFLFGDSDFTARIGPVLFGLGVVGMIYLLRVYIGRLGAIMAGIMVTFGPTLLFHSRYIRDDIFMAFFTLVWIYGAFRYLDTRRMRYLVIMVAGMAFGFVTMENHFIHGAIIGSFFVMLGLWQVSGRFGLFSVMAPVAISGGAWWLLHEAGQDTFALVAMGIGLIIAAVALVMALRGRWHSVRRNAPADLAVLMLTLILPFLAAFIFVFTGGDPKTFSFAADYTKPEVIIKLAIYVALCAAASIAIGVAWFWHHGAPAVDTADAEHPDAEVHAIEPWRPGLAQWAMLMGFFWLVQVLFFTTFFTNTRDGLATGIVGSLGYWVAQQGVKRGNQPIYYYALVGWLYEFLPAILSLCGITTVFYNVSRRLRNQTSWDPVAAGDLPPKCYGVRDADENGAVALSDCSSMGTRETFALFSIWWIFGAWLGYTVAGEKMPWLLTHMALPMSIFGGWWFGNMLRNVDWAAAWRKHTWLLVFAAPALFVLALVMWVASTPTGTEPDLASTILQWLLIFAATAAIVFLGAYWSVRDGIKQGLRLLGAGAVAMLFLLTIRTSFILNYVNYDMATEFLVYAHASPDVKRALSEIDTISQRTVGDRNIVVAYDDQSAWPMSWYMRQYPNAKYYGNNPTTDAMAAPAIIVGPDNRSKVEPYVSRDYVKRTYRLIWWPEMDYFGLFECPEIPEEGTQDPAITPASSAGCKVRWDRLWGAIADPAQRDRLFNIIAFRKYKNPDDLSQWRDLAKWPFRHEFDLWVRRDLAPTIWDLNLLPSAEQSLAVDVPVIAPEQLRSVTATQVYNLLYDGLPLTAPRAVAIGPNGERVIADTGNHRIVVLDNQGEFIRAFGSFCNVADP
ncbi:MAG: TIGR03663 family protein [Anaerolineales bacterium]|nr:TIGR03663 family protein [Anaerolineales bacterium]